MYDGKTFGEYLDYKLNVFLKHYIQTNKNIPDFLKDEEWDAILNNMVSLSNSILDNNSKLANGILVANNKYIDDIGVYLEQCDMQISHIEAESFALREKLFRLINEYWVYLN